MCGTYVGNAVTVTPRKNSVIGKIQWPYEFCCLVKRVIIFGMVWDMHDQLYSIVKHTATLISLKQP